MLKRFASVFLHKIWLNIQTLICFVTIGILGRVENFSSPPCIFFMRRFVEYIKVSKIFIDQRLCVYRWNRICAIVCVCDRVRMYTSSTLCVYNGFYTQWKHWRTARKFFVADKAMKRDWLLLFTAYNMWKKYPPGVSTASVLTPQRKEKASYGRFFFNTYYLLQKKRSDEAAIVCK